MYICIITWIGLIFNCLIKYSLNIDSFISS
jgi:hypothetical protein